LYYGGSSPHHDGQQWTDSGTMPRKTVENLKRLGLRDQDMMMVPMLALRSSVEIVNIFIDYDRNRIACIIVSRPYIPELAKQIDSIIIFYLIDFILFYIFIYLFITANQ